MHEVARRAGRARANMGATLAVLAVLLPVVGCTGQNKENAAMSTDADATTEAPPLRKLNPAPRQAYEIRVGVENAPGPFGSIRGTAQYDVSNEEQCGRYLEFAGVHPRITSNESFTLARVSDTEYVGTVYVDQILDEDYFGRGVCKWDFTEARVSLSGTDASRSSRFVAGIDSKVITQQGEALRYFWRQHYLDGEEGDFPLFGRENLSNVQEQHRAEYFRVSLAAKEIAS